MAGQMLQVCECQLLKELRIANVLQDVEGHRLDQKDGVILVTCADGDRFYDIFQKQCSMMKPLLSPGEDPRVHTLSWNGGALKCAPGSPVHKRAGAHLEFLDDVSGSRILKKINTVALYAHLPCGMAKLHDINLIESINFQIQAKTEIKKLNDGVNVAPFFAVDYGDGKKRTYFLSRSHWEEWRKEKHEERLAGSIA